MAFLPSYFADGDSATGATAIGVFFQLEGMEEYAEGCILSYSESPNLQLETFYEICNNGTSNTRVVGYDPEFQFEMIVRKGAISAEMLRNRYNPKAIMNVPMRVLNTLLDEQLDTNVVLTNFDISYMPNELLKITVTAKPSSGAPVIDTIDPVFLATTGFIDPSAPPVVPARNIKKGE